MWDPNTNKTGSTILKEWTTPDSRHTPSTTNLEEEEIVGALGNDGNASMPEQVRPPNPWRKMMMIDYILYILGHVLVESVKQLKLNNQRSNPGRAFSLLQNVQTVSAPPQATILNVLGLCPGVKQPSRAHHSPLLVLKLRSYSSTSPYAIMAWTRTVLL